MPTFSKEQNAQTTIFRTTFNDEKHFQETD